MIDLFQPLGGLIFLTAGYKKDRIPSKNSQLNFKHKNNTLQQNNKTITTTTTTMPYLLINNTPGLDAYMNALACEAKLQADEKWRNLDEKSKEVR